MHGYDARREVSWGRLGGGLPRRGILTSSTSRTWSGPTSSQALSRHLPSHPLSFGYSVPRSSASVFYICCFLCLGRSSPRQEPHGVLLSGLHSNATNPNLPSCLMQM